MPCTRSPPATTCPMAGPRLDQLLERMDINVALAARLQGTIGMPSRLSPFGPIRPGQR